MINNKCMLNIIYFNDKLNDYINIFINFDDDNVPKMMMIFFNSILILAKIFINNYIVK